MIPGLKGQNAPRQKEDGKHWETLLLLKKFLRSEGEEKGFRSKLVFVFLPCGRSYPGPQFTWVSEDVTVSCCLRLQQLKQ